MDLSCENERLSELHKLDEGLQFILHLEGVQSARVLRYAICQAGARSQMDSHLKSNER
jgi:hypothetical protein